MVTKPSDVAVSRLLDAILLISTDVGYFSIY